jgi:predicted anti-sigma-YlaC factor YlaD
MTPPCDEIRLDLGAYLLGALDPVAGDAVASHLETCQACREAYEEIAPVPVLLSRVPGNAFGDTPDPRSGQAERLLAEIDGIRRRRRRITAGVVAAMVAVAIGVVGTMRLNAPAPHAGVVVAATSASHTGVAGRAILTPTPEGTTLTVTLHGVRPGTRCQLVVMSASGRHEVAATWRASYDGDATVTGASAFTPQQIRRLLVVAGPRPPLAVLAVD